MTDQIERQINLDEVALNQLRHTVKNNTVKTSKYTWWNFIPINLFEQFNKLSNVYFFIIMIMQTIDEISISNG